MDVERLEQWVLNCPLQELVFQHASSFYTLWNDPAKPAWWTITDMTNERCVRHSQKVRGLNHAVTLIEHLYPDFYAWLAWRFPNDGKLP
ncbi:MAG: hypothetical protein ACR2H5_13235 [Ktedonobacteraceae bacterium]